MKLHKILFTDVITGIFLLLGITTYIAGSMYIRNKSNKKIREDKEISLLNQAKENFEELLNKHLQFPIRIA